MAHHKRRRPKNQRAGCLMCKPWKGNGAKDKTLDKYLVDTDPNVWYIETMGIEITETSLPVGTVIKYVKDGKKVEVTLTERIDSVELFAFVDDETSLVAWPDAPGGRAFATEPAES